MAVRDRPSIDGLKASLRGELLQPGDPGYDAARVIYNKMIDRRPALIVRCADEADVISAVNYAREAKIASVSIRGGGHNVTGFAMNDGGLVIDLSRMRGIHVDPDTQTVRAEGGCTFGDLDHATHAFGYAVPAGVISTTGIGGLTLGGGIGHLTRAYGLSCDSLISADVVTADGKLVTASATKNPDLFWGLRGGGGNFGVVVSFEYRMHPASTVIGGPVIYPLEKSREALRFYRDYMASAPDDMSAFFAFLIVPDVEAFPAPLRNQRVCAVVACYTGPMEKAEEVVKPLRQFGPPLLDAMGPIPLPVLNSMFDFTLPIGELQNYWKADFVNEISDAAIEEHVKYGTQVPRAASLIHIYPVNGAAGRVGKDDTAWAYRDANYVHIIAAIHPDPADNAQGKEWVRGYWEALHPYSAGGAYVNFLMDEGQDRIKATYRGHYDRLAALKRKYDPTNLFHMNQNIPPA